MMKTQKGSDGCGRRPQLINLSEQRRRVLDMKMYHNKSLTMKVLLGLAVAGCFLPRQAQAAEPTDIHSFVTCVNNLAAAGATVVDAVNSCVPNSGCYYTNTLSEESAQPACTLRDGTRLPRVIFSCTGPNGSQKLRFRPAFSLCTLGSDAVASVINHVEVGEDVPVVIDSTLTLKLGDMELPSPKPFSDFGTGGTLPVVDTTAHRVCTDCHDPLGTTAGGVNLFRPIRPELKEGTIDTNDPTVEKPASPVPLSAICGDINHSTQLAKNPSKKQLAYKLCEALLAKEQ